MNYLQEKLDSLYTERANLRKQIEELNERIAAIGVPVQSAGVSAAQRSALLMVRQVGFTEKEIGWIEHQILALLSNPGLAS